MVFEKSELYSKLLSGASKQVLHPSEFATFCYSSMGLSPTQLRCQIDEWLKEDAGAGDASMFSILREEAARCADFFIVAKEDFILCGRHIMAEILRRSCGNELKLYSDFLDGNEIKKGSVVLSGSGPAGGILLAERTILNLSCKLSGIATKTNSTLKKIKAAAANCMHPILLETRKTTPGLRVFEKYATRTGGARNHRHGLDSGAMLKENHLRLISNFESKLSDFKKNLPVLTKLEVEVSNLEELKLALTAGVDVIMLDNFSEQDIASAIQLRSQLSPHTLLELSGNLDKQSAAFLANCGVDFVSQGALIHQAVWVDMSLQLFAGQA